MKKKLLVTAAAVAVVILLLILLFQENSQALALTFAGLDLKKDTYVIERLDLDEDGREFKVLQGTMKDGKLALVQLTKNGWGFWQVTDLETQVEGVNYLCTAWLKRGGRTRYGEDGSLFSHYEVHYVICGTDAQKLFDYRELDLSGNVTIDAYQEGPFYILHMTKIAFNGDYDDFTGSTDQITESLRSIGFIPAASSAESSNNFFWDMTAIVIKPDDSQSITTTLSIQGNYPNDQPDAVYKTINMQMDLNGDSGYGSSGASAYTYLQHEAFGIGDILHISTYFADGKTNAPTSVRIGLDLDNACIIVLFEEHPGECIVASNNPNDTPEDILEHFASYIDFCLDRSYIKEGIN